jgi:hypothetical protein
MHIVLVAGDPQADYACGLLAVELESLGASCLLVRPPLSPRMGPPCEPVEGVDTLQCTPAELLCHNVLLNAEALGVFLSGEDLTNFVSNYRQICRLQGRKAATVFSGPIFPLGGDALVADLLPRLSCDLVCLHGERQLAEYADLTRHWPAAPPAAINLGFWFMPESPPDGGLVGLQPANPPHTLVVLAQAQLPSPVGSMARMLRILVALADAAPHWRVLIQRDHSVQSGQPWLSAKQGGLDELPANLAFGAVENLPLILGRASACLTLSSPWVLTAMAWGRACMLIGDYGIRTDQGSALFFGSGVMGRLDALEHLDALLNPPPLNRDWLNELGWAVDDGPIRLLRALQELTQR